MYSSVPRIRPSNASESCDHKDSRRPLLPAVRQQRAQKLEEREAAAAAAAAAAQQAEELAPRPAAMQNREPCTLRGHGLLRSFDEAPLHEKKGK